MNVSSKPSETSPLQSAPFSKTLTHHLVLQWIPSYCDIPGHERKDFLAKKGAANREAYKLNRKPQQNKLYTQTIETFLEKGG